MQEINIVYSGASTRKRLYTYSSTVVSISGDANSTKFIFDIPSIYSVYTATIIWNIKVLDTDDNLVTPSYTLTDGVFLVPDEITSNCQGKLVTFYLQFTKSDATVVEKSLPLGVFINKSLSPSSDARFDKETYSFVTKIGTSISETEEGVTVQYTSYTPSTSIVTSGDFTIPTADNTSLGLVKGSEDVGKVKINGDGTMSTITSNSTVTLLPENWVGYTYTATLQGITEDSNIIVMYDNDSLDEVRKTYVSVSALAEDSIICTCEAVPTKQIKMKVLVI